MPWPNWVDLVVVIIVLRACYIGYARGVVTELLHLAVAVTVTSLVVNYWSLAAGWVRNWVALQPELVNVAVFWLLFLIGLMVMRWLIKRVGSLLGWERLHWTFQTIGIILGTLRGLWWAGFLVVVLTSTGVPYLHASVEERSIIGPRLVRPARETLERIADSFPGANNRPRSTLPALMQQKKTAPDTE